MKHYDYQIMLKELWEKAVEIYAAGNREADAYFDSKELQFLCSIGITAHEVYDYTEDYHNAGEPDFPTFAMIHDIRRSFFLEVQNGEWSSRIVEEQSLAPKKSSLQGIPWLPRIIQKAKAKIRGELDPEIMYSCGGDRRFLKESDIHPAEFLRVVGENEDDDDTIIKWVVNRRESSDSD